MRPPPARFIALATAVLAGAVFVVGCDPSTPTEVEARAWLEADRSTLETFSSELETALRESQVLEPTQQGRDGDMERVTRRERRLARLREQTLPALLSDPRMIGVELRIRPETPEPESDLPPELMEEMLGRAGSAPPPHKNDIVRAADGATVDGRQLGWGVYQVEDDGGDWAYHRGYELAFAITSGARSVDAILFMQAPD